MRGNPERWDISVYVSFGGCSRLESTSPAELLLPAVTISNLGTVNGFYRTATVGCLESNFHVITAGNMNDPRLSQTAVTAIRLTEWQSHEERLLSDVISSAYLSVGDHIIVVALPQATLDATVSILVPAHATRR